jgi:tape measure domain-containing protein
VAEQLGEARLKLSVDDAPLKAGLQRAQQQAQQTGAGINQAFTGSTRSINTLQARLDSLRSSFNAAEIGSREFRKLQAEIRKTEQELGKVDQTLGSTFRDRAGGFGGGLLGALGIGAGIGVGAAAGGFIKSSIDQAIELESITRKLSNTLGQQGAGAALNFTNGLAQELGLNFKVLSGAFASFTAAATAANVPLETQKDLFAAVSKAGQALGLSNDEINGSLLALQQVASKGTVSMEELRGQLGERLPIALSAAAKGLGLNQEQLIKLVESGKLTSQQFFPALTRGLNELTAGAGGLETSAQKLQKFQNAWQELQTSFGTNLLPGITATVGELTKAIEGLGVASEAKRLGFSTGLLNGVSTQGAQAVGALRAAQKQFNLNDQQAKTIFDQALAASGAGRGALTFGFNDKEYLKLLDQIFEKAKQFRNANPDKQAALQAEAAAAQALAKQQEAAAAARQKEIGAEIGANAVQGGIEAARERLRLAQASNTESQAAVARAQAELQINQRLRDIDAARLAIKQEEAKPAGQQSPEKLRELRGNLQVAQLELQATRTEADAGIRRGIEADARSAQSKAKELLDKQRQAADKLDKAGLGLQRAGDGLNQTLRGGFEFLTPQLQQQQLARARAAIQPLVDRGVIREGIDISTPERLFRVAAFAEQLAPAQKQLEDAIRQNTDATAANTAKDTNVYLQLPGQSTPLPLPAV